MLDIKTNEFKIIEIIIESEDRNELMNKVEELEKDGYKVRTMYMANKLDESKRWCVELSKITKLN